MSTVNRLIGYLILFYNGGTVAANCYFQQDFQGDYVMQSSVTGSGVQYTTLYINDTSISIFGNCHKRIGNNYFLQMSFGGTNCIRCLHLKLRSPNILQITTSYNTFSKCHINEEQAEKMCLGENGLQTKNLSEILLFKTRAVHQLPTVKRFCPFDRSYSISYSSKDSKSRRNIECNGVDSTVSSCSSGSILNVKLKGCNSNINDFSFECLGNWRNLKGENFLVFTDSRHDKPKYRCGVYEKERETGRILMALSNDSTCVTDLHNTTSGFETFILEPKQEIPWPENATFETCVFPEWMQGNWEYITVDGNTLIYHNHTSFKTYTIKCTGSEITKNKYLVYSRTQCDEDHYNCLWIHKRTNNILEFQLGIKFSHTRNIHLCQSDNFLQDSWVTQGRIDATSLTSNEYQSLCPISGEYTGRIPDDHDLCAKMKSDCAAEMMYYQVYSCSTGEIIEEREYTCLGHWREQDLLYTYTQRMDVASGTYECFVGSITPKEEIFITEAGSFCQRNMDPLRKGMQLIKLQSCVESKPLSTNTSTETYHTITEPYQPKITTTTLTTIALTKSTRKPWNFDNDINDIEPKTPNETNQLTVGFLLYIITHIVVLFIR